MQISQQRSQSCCVLDRIERVGTRSCCRTSQATAPAFLSTSATMGTVELTGLLMTAIHAFGQCWAMPSASPATISAHSDAISCAALWSQRVLRCSVSVSRIDCQPEYTDQDTLPSPIGKVPLPTYECLLKINSPPTRSALIDREAYALAGHTFAVPCAKHHLPTGIDVEKVLAGHARLPRHAGGDDGQLDALQGLAQLRGLLLLLEAALKCFHLRAQVGCHECMAFQTRRAHKCTPQLMPLCSVAEACRETHTALRSGSTLT